MFRVKGLLKPKLSPRFMAEAFILRDRLRCNLTFERAEIAGSERESVAFSIRFTKLCIMLNKS